MNNIKIIYNFAWRFFERSSTHGITLCVSIILARILGPDIFGTIALIMVFTSILEPFINSGLANALIQKKSADDTDFSTVFYFNILLCIFLYLILYLFAPKISHFYHKSNLTLIIRILGLSLIISGIRNIQQAYISRNMLFKIFFFSTLISTSISAFISILMAIYGYGIWSLVTQQLLNNIIGTIILWYSTKWRPKLLFSYIRLKKLLGFGWKLLFCSLIDRCYMEMRALIIGRLYKPTDLAFYNRGYQFPNLLINNINDSINSVIFPTISQLQDNKEQVKKIANQGIQYSFCFVAPAMVGLASIATPLVRILLSDKWLPCVPYLRISCISLMFMPIHYMNLNIITALGRSDLALKLEIIKKIIGFILLLSSMKFGVLAMAYTLLIQCFFSIIINIYPNKKLINYSYMEQLKAIFPYLSLAFVMGILIFPISLLKYPNYIILFSQIIIGAFIYIGCLALLKLDCYEKGKKLFISFIKKR